METLEEMLLEIYKNDGVHVLKCHIALGNQFVDPNERENDCINQNEELSGSKFIVKNLIAKWEISNKI